MSPGDEYMKGKRVFVQCNGFFCSTKPSDKRNSKSNANKSCFISTSESAFDFRIYLVITWVGMESCLNFCVF